MTRAAPQLLAALCVLLPACNQEHAGGRSTAADPVRAGSTAEYDWYAEGTPAGSHAVSRSGDGQVRTEMFVHWNNREYRIVDELTLGADGLPVAQRITGISAFGATVDESFVIEDGVAIWRTPGESGSSTAATDAFYLPNEWGALESLAALVRAASKNPDGEIELVPPGTAKVSRVAGVASPATGGATVSLYAIEGIEFTPRYIWLDEELDLFALDEGGFMGAVRKGHDEALLTELSRVQSEHEADYFEAKSAELAQPLDKPLIFAYANVVDVASGKLLTGHHVSISDGKIREVSASPLETSGALVIDAGGKTLIPGLWDMHGHFELSDGILNIAAGVTSVRDVGNVHEKILDMTEKFAAGTVVGPNTYRSGFIDQASPYASGDTVASLEEALERVDFYAEHGYIQIKLYSSIDPSWVAPIAERTHAHGMRLSGHIPAFMSAEQAVRAGYDEIQHINMVFLNFLAGDREDTRKQLRFTLYGDKAGDVDLASAAADAFFELLAKHNVVIDPTAAIFDTQLVHKSGQPDPTYAAVIDHLPATVRRRLYNPEMEITEDNEAAWARSRENAMRMLKTLFERGVRIVPGSDAYAGLTIHRELELYAEAGIPNADVLRLATLGSAEVVGVADRTGSIAPGKDADVVLLDGNPLDDISAVRRAVTVVKGGHLYRPDELYPAVGMTPVVPSLPARAEAAAATR